MSGFECRGRNMKIQSGSLERSVAPTNKTVSLLAALTQKHPSARGMTPYLQMKLKTTLTKEMLQRVLVKKYNSTNNTPATSKDPRESKKPCTVTIAPPQLSAATYQGMTFSRQAKMPINAN